MRQTYVQSYGLADKKKFEVQVRTCLKYLLEIDLKETELRERERERRVPDEQAKNMIDINVQRAKKDRFAVGDFNAS